MRPEAWPFLAAYGLWLWRRDPPARRGVAAVGVAVPLLWLGPDLVGIGGAVTASEAARGEPSPESAVLEDVPALAVLGDALLLLTVPAALAAVVGALAGPRIARFLLAAALAWIAIVAAMAQAGYAGNPRYLVAAIALGCVLAGVGAARAGELIRSRAASARPGAAAARARRLAPVLVAAWLVAGVALATAEDLSSQVDLADARADSRAALPELVAEAGGRDALVDCARVRTADDMRPLVAWELDLPMLDVDVAPEPPAVVLRWRPHYVGPVEPVGDFAAAGFRRLAAVPGWEAWARCGPAPQTTG